ncbi:MAG: tRNA (guanosine(46)-N7)-methyltransferase TrmB [Deferribacteres bacterium]|nr:tRNA (guanosine(46)-N7)-methyltransferase TrmB [candidate division KSB1 bacterium]MCB9503903.1 tRNA (guanosine(46)-N7)-methyltransferase TrmB [Deferribacteres bacterium]
MSRHKLKKFAAAVNAPNILFEPRDRKGNWKQSFFKNTNPLVVELGCGRGEYTLALARMFPEKNFIGVDLKVDRLWAGACIAREQHITNMVFIRINIYELLNFFMPNEIDEIWITFPDPFSKGSKLKKRLTSTTYIQLYRSVLAEGGFIHFKTDHTSLYQFTKKVCLQENMKILQDIDDLYNTEIEEIVLTIQTAFEKKHLQMNDTIKYLKMQF